MRVQKYYVKIKHYLRQENKVNENKVLSSCEALVYMCQTYKPTIISNLISKKWNNSIISSNKPSLAIPTIGMYMSLRKSFFQLPR